MLKKSKEGKKSALIEPCSGAANPSGWIDLGDTRSDTTALWTATGPPLLYVREKNSNDGF